MNLPFKIARRYFFSRKRQGGFNTVSLISYISLLGYLVGAAALLIVLSVFNGFELLFTRMYSNFDADLQVLPAKGKYISVDNFPIDKLMALPGLEGVCAVWEENALLRYADKQAIGTVKGVDENYLQTCPLDTHLVRGALLLEEGDTNYAIVGQGIAYQLGLDPDDPFRFLGVYLPRKGKVDMSDPTSAFAQGIISPSGIISVQEEVDNRYVLLPLRYVFALLEDSSRVSHYELRLKPGTAYDEAAETLMSALGDQYQVKNRFEQRESFFKVMRSEKTISFFILVFILLIAAFNTVGSLYMLVIEKRKDLSVLSSMGITPQRAAQVFMWESLLIAITGGTLGLLVGLAVCYGQQHFQWVALRATDGTVLNAYPVVVKYADVAKVFLTLLGLGLLTSLYPAWKAGKIAEEK